MPKMKEQKICDEVEKTVPSAAEQETSRASPQGCHNGTHGIASSPAPGGKKPPHRFLQTPSVLHVSTVNYSFSY